MKISQHQPNPKAYHHDPALVINVHCCCAIWHLVEPFDEAFESLGGSMELSRKVRCSEGPRQPLGSWFADDHRIAFFLSNARVLGTIFPDCFQIILLEPPQHKQPNCDTQAHGTMIARNQTSPASHLRH